MHTPYDPADDYADRRQTIDPDHLRDRAPLYAPRSVKPWQRPQLPARINAAAVLVCYSATDGQD